MRYQAAIVTMLLCTFCASVSPARAAESAKRLAQMDANCNKNTFDLIDIIQADRKAGKVPSYAAHPGLIDRLAVADQDCESAVTGAPDNPQYNLHAGTLEVLTGTGDAKIHAHGIAYLTNAMIYALHQNDPIDLDSACRVSRAFARPGEYRCGDEDFARAETGVKNYFAELRREAAVADAINAARFRALEHEQEDQMMMYHFGE